jgi:glycosyltransferase involved in cell wall biosynthesis
LSQIKVIQIIDSLNVGGAEVLAVNIANGLASTGIDSHLCVTRKEGDLKRNIKSNVGYLFLDRKSTFDVGAIFKLKLYIKKNKITTIHAHSSSSFIAFCIKIIAPKINVFWHDHYGNSEFLRERNLYPLKIFSLFFKGIITVNKKLKLWSEQNLLTSNVSFINNFPLFNDVKTKTILKGTNGKRVVHLAGFREQKDHLNLLTSFKKIVIDFPDWSLHLIGKNNNDDNYSNSIKEFIEIEGLTDNVFMYGVCSDIKNILNQSDIGVLSSKSEGLPISLLEYGLAKIAVLVTDVGECRNVVKNKIVIVPKQRSDKFALALRHLIENPELRREISYNFNKEILKNYSQEIIINKLIKIYSF